MFVLILRYKKFPRRKSKRSVSCDSNLKRSKNRRHLRIF
ncbi:hypothetical protein LEP1GSC060_3868 [Leptospira weilii serovar Ranarum str. ICFT]|uniref:Uncharacterized protein n=1 Tax=Leptospira weilii serovar Ranarum str. ICFT TaxID=1218598 RepID=N1WMS1_9LEPT|nr:hypothetical protein LEP1GSC060_3868 [Leptospira weilii serovar Ranarum str. ICFT]